MACSHLTGLWIGFTVSCCHLKSGEMYNWFWSGGRESWPCTLHRLLIPRDQNARAVMAEDLVPGRTLIPVGYLFFFVIRIVFLSVFPLDKVGAVQVLIS